MGKLVFRLRPCNIYEVPVIEAWLEEMAAEGLHLQGMYPMVSAFYRGEPKRVKYRFEPRYVREKTVPYEPKDAFPEESRGEQMELYRECGWEYVDEFVDYYLFRSESETSVEVHTDPVAHGRQYVGLQRALRVNFIAGFGLVAYHLAQLWNRVSGSGLYHTLTEFNDLFFLLVYLGCGFILILRWRSVDRLMQAVTTGASRPAQVDWRGRMRRRRLGCVMWAGIIGTILFSVIGEAAWEWERPSAEVRAEVPLFTLAEMEEREGLTYASREPWVISMGSWEVALNGPNWVEHRWDILVPEQYQEEQEGSTYIVGVGEYRPNLEVEYKRFRFEWLAAGYYQEELRELAVPSERVTDLPGFDEAVLYHGTGDELGQVLYGRIGNVIVRYQYNGEQDLEQFAGAIAAASRGE